MGCGYKLLAAEMKIKERNKMQEKLQQTADDCLFLVNIMNITRCKVFWIWDGEITGG